MSMLFSQRILIGIILVCSLKINVYCFPTQNIEHGAVPANSAPVVGSQLIAKPTDDTKQVIPEKNNSKTLEITHEMNSFAIQNKQAEEHIKLVADGNNEKGAAKNNIAKNPKVAPKNNLKATANLLHKKKNAPVKNSKVNVHHAINKQSKMVGKNHNSLKMKNVHGGLQKSAMQNEMPDQLPSFDDNNYDDLNPEQLPYPDEPEPTESPIQPPAPPPFEPTEAPEDPQMPTQPTVTPEHPPMPIEPDVTTPPPPSPDEPTEAPVNTPVPDEPIEVTEQPQTPDEPVETPDEPQVENPEQSPAPGEPPAGSAPNAPPNGSQNNIQPTTTTNLNPPMQQPIQPQAAAPNPTPMNVAGSNQYCPEEIESLGCFNSNSAKPKLFPNLITKRKPGDTLEDFLCDCGNKVQSQGLYTFTLQNDQCFSGPNEGAYANYGDSEQCVNDQKMPCSDQDTYCQGGAESMNVYSIITADHQGVAKHKIH